jgi:hypothetical protein
MRTRAEVTDIDMSPPDGFCAACDLYGSLGVTGLCADCGARLERDLIRRRDWSYCYSAFGMSDSARESLRREVLRKYGTALELLVDNVSSKRARKRGKRRKRRKL